MPVKPPVPGAMRASPHGHQEKRRRSERDERRPHPARAMTLGEIVFD